MKYDIELCLKVSEKQWIEKLKDGEAYFNPVGFFIKKAEEKGNNEQGDRYEGVFARIKATDKRLTELKDQFGDELEIIPDSEYVLLRRKTVRRIPIFCMYGVRRDELEIKEDTICKKGGEYIGKAIYNFPEQIYRGFLDGNNPWGFYASSGHFMEAIEQALEKNNLCYKKVVIAYDLDLNQEFFFEPNEEYSELNHKRPDLQYQHEVRYYLINHPQDKGFTLNYDPLSDRSCGIFPNELYLEISCILDVLEE